jgi:NADH-quinone oxidoreductase subunit E
MPTETMDTARIDEIVAGYPPESRFALAILQDIQHACNYIPREALPKVEAHIGTTEGQLYALATFYKALSLTPKGKHVIKLCDGTACHMRGANNLVGELTRQLNLDDDGRTDDGQFSLELVNCLGSCALAPVMVIDETYYGKVTMEALPGILSPYRASRDAHDGKGGDLDE